MKKATSILLILAFVLTSAVGASAQKMRAPRPGVPVVIPAAADSQYSKAGAFTDGTRVLVRWEMTVEVENLGFYIYQLTGKGESLVSTEILPGAALSIGPIAHYGQVYDFYVPDPQENAAYFIESVSTRGERRRTEAFTPAYISSLDGIVGKSAAQAETINKSGTGVITSSNLDLSKTLSAEVRDSIAAPDPTLHRWVISRPGVKIGVRGEGIYRVTRAELQAGGFDVTSDPTQWQLYLRGVQQAITVDPSGNFIEFFGRAVDTVESDITVYYLIAGDAAGKRITPRVARPGANVSSKNYSHTFHKRERTIYVNQVLNGELENYFGRVVTATQTTLPFTLTGIDPTAETATLTVAFQGYNFDIHEIEMILNGHLLAPANGEGRSPFSRSQTIPAAWLIEGANSLKFRATGPAGDQSLFDHLDLSFARKYLAEANTLKFPTQNYRRAMLDGFTSSDVRIYDITAADEPLLMSNIPIVQRGSTFGPNMPAARERLFYVIESSAVKNVFSVEQNNPSLFGIPGHAAELVIISHKNFLTQAETWANYRRGQGFGVRVVDVADIYDEFNYGVLSSASITSFLNYARTNWQTPPRYLLIIGDASYDSRNYQGTGYFNMVPTKFVTTVFTETGSDEGLADFDGDGLAELAVGRIAVRESQFVTDIFNRQVAWEASLNNPLERGATFANDLNNDFDFASMSQRLRDRLPPTMPVTMISRASPTAHQDLIASINTGKYLVNYVGHGTSTTWAASNFFTVLHIPQLTNANGSSRSLFTMLTCLNGFFVSVTGDSLAEALVKANNGGAVAAWASAGLTTPDVQEIMASQFLGQLAAGDIPRMGDLVKDAKTSIPGGSDVRLSWALIGDPMLKVR